MRRVAAGLIVLLGSGAGIGVVLLAACGGGNSGSGFPDSGATTIITLPDGNVVTVPPGTEGGTVLLPPGTPTDGGTTVTYTDSGCEGLQCAIAACSNDGGTTITGKVLDPAGANPIYNVTAYVPKYDPANPSAIPAGSEIQAITGGVSFPSGVTCDSCSYLYTGDPIAVGTSGTDGTFTITNAPSGKNIPVVIQVGKWRTHTTVSTVTDCQSASAGDIKLPGSADGTDPIVSMPQIAISMGGSDTLECLPYRMGIAQSEFVSGAGGKGHFHVFTGGQSFGGGGNPPPTSSTNMWNSLASLEKYDVSLFSCEGDETTNANPQVLEQYVNAGGRAFMSHFHYAWLAGPLHGGASYTANADWGTNLATWNKNDQAADFGHVVGGKIASTLNVGGGPFIKGEALQTWLGNVGALGQSGVPATEVPINSPSYDPNVTSANTISQPWVTWDYSATGDAKTYPTGYFSFNTPVGATAPPDGGAAPYCGRVVFSGLHVGAAASDTTGGREMPSSSTCSPAPGNLSPQEKVLEFMLFDLSSCVTPENVPPGHVIPTPPPPVPK